jgi:hypothetical protein
MIPKPDVVDGDRYSRFKAKTKYLIVGISLVFFVSVMCRAFLKGA